jgi:hypothetical protein
LRDEPVRTVKRERRAGCGFYQKKKRKATIICLPLLKPFAKSAVEIYRTFKRLKSQDTSY